MTRDMPRVAVREVAGGDGEFLVDMLFESVNWESERFTRRQLLSTPALARYVTGWGRPGDLGLVAVELDGPGGLQIPVGAAWLRLFPATEPGYGFVAAGVPELSIAIVPGRRRQGIGRALLDALLTKAQEAGTTQVSLSVEPLNPALALYLEAGFVRWEGQEAKAGESLTLLRTAG